MRPRRDHRQPPGLRRAHLARVHERQRMAEVGAGGRGSAQQRRGPVATEQFQREVGFDDVVEGAGDEAHAGERGEVLWMAHGLRPRYQSARPPAP
jgi:hypothetical protein